MKKPFVIAVASGKGGTGKTTISVSLALSSPSEVTLLDCDVEEPNCDIFLKPQSTIDSEVTSKIPQVDKTKCNACGKCAKTCRFNAIASLPSGPMFFPELCHSCGGCMLACPSGAITEKDLQIGVIKESKCININFVQGIMEVGRPISPPVIKSLKRHISPEHLTIIDCPPGTSCPMVSAVKGSDFILLVTEPTPFGLNDLILAVETVRKLKIPFGVILNRADSGDDRVDAYCERESIPLLLRIPECRSVAEAYSKGESIIKAMPIIEGKLVEMLSNITCFFKVGRSDVP